ncbi:hypothetical protein [Pseudofulvibacter geojedonensis]|uniref:Uncharacterized protein n=1 Tax=Pseudofulvibacter geojedonensis TaxID=1123758 RepID=A0ABW3I4K8_9FLAO
MKVDIQIVITIVSSLITGIIAFFLVKSKLKDEINVLKVELEKLKAKDNEQQVVINEIKRQFDELLPVLIKKLNKKNGK